MNDTTKEKRRARGLGRVYPCTYRHCDGSKSTIWWVAYYWRGKQIRESSGSARQSDAARLLKRRLGEIGRGHVNGAKIEKTTFDDLARLIRDDYRLNGYRSADGVLEPALAHLREHFEHVPVVAVTPGRLSAYATARLAEGAKPSTVARDLRAFRRAFTLGLRSGMVAQVPPFPTLPATPARKGFCAQEQIERVIAHLPDYLKPVIRALYVTGWRRNEITRLTWDRVDFEAGTIRLDPEDSKTGEPRAFPFGADPVLRALFEERWETTRAAQREWGTIIPLVFWRGRHKAVAVRDFRKAWADATKAAGVPGLLIHDLRRSAARNLVRAGVSEHVAMKALGHRSPSMFRRYNIVSPTDLAEAVAKQRAYLQREPAGNPQDCAHDGSGSGVAVPRELEI